MEYYLNNKVFLSRNSVSADSCPAKIDVLKTNIWVLSIPVFSANGHYGLIVANRGLTLSRHAINLNQ